MQILKGRKAKKLVKGYGNNNWKMQYKYEVFDKYYNVYQRYNPLLVILDCLMFIILAPLYILIYGIVEYVGIFKTIDFKWKVESCNRHERFNKALKEVEERRDGNNNNK